MSARWEESLLALFDDLEQQAEGLHLRERAAEVTALAEAQQAEVALGDRVHAATGAGLVLRLRGGLLLRAVVLRAGAGWVLLRDDQEQPWLVPDSGLASVAGLPPRAVAPEARTVIGRLGLGSALRGLAARHHECVVHLVDGHRLEGRLNRVGADFIELTDPAAVQAVPTAAISAIQGRR